MQSQSEVNIPIPRVDAPRYPWDYVGKYQYVIKVSCKDSNVKLRVALT